MSRQIMQQALDALKNYHKSDDDRLAVAMDILHQALAQPEHPLDKKADNARELGLDYEPEQKPVVWMEMVVANLVRLGVVKHKAKELAYHFYTYDPPPKREWVGLTDDEILQITMTHQSYFRMGRAIESACREKNG